MSKNPLLQTLISMTGQDNVITVHRPFVKFTGTLEAAMMLSQLLYWTPRTIIPDGWIAKSDKDWQKELCLSRHGSRQAAKTLLGMDVIETKLKKFKGAPTVHYRVKWESLESKWTDWLRLSENEQTESAKTDNPLSENGQSLTEIKTETTQRVKRPALDFKNMTVSEARKVPSIRLYTDASGFFPGSVVWEYVHNTITENKLTSEKIQAAAVEWSARGYKPANVKGILEWAINGIPNGKTSPTPEKINRPEYKPFKAEENANYIPNPYPRPRIATG
jgi:hypothetical protein